MRTLIAAVALAGTASLFSLRVVAEVSTADVSRVIAMAFAADVGAAAGDVNADGRANAADICGVLLGLHSPTQPGPFGVGLHRMTFTKPSETMPDETRELLTDIWYPAPPGAGPIDRRPGGQADAPFAEGLENLPLVMFSHGSCGFQEQSIFLTSLIASYGFIVAAPPHPGNTTQAILTCGTPDALADSFANRPADISFVIDELLALNANPSSFLFGKIDPNRIGMSGHSFGGQTTLRVSVSDPRVIAGLALAPAAASILDDVASIRIPMMIQDGPVDSLTPFGANAQAAYARLGPPRYLVDILRSGHYAFSDICVGPPDCGIGTDTLNQDEAHAAVLRYAIPFLLHWVAGDTRFDAFLAPGAAPPGIVVSSDVGSG